MHRINLGPWIALLLPAALFAQSEADGTKVGRANPPAPASPVPPKGHDAIYGIAADAFRTVHRLRASDPRTALKTLDDLEAAVAKSDDKTSETSKLIDGIRASIRSSRNEISRYWPTLQELAKRLATNPDDRVSVDDYVQKLSREIDKLTRRDIGATAAEVLESLYKANQKLEVAADVFDNAHRTAKDNAARLALQTALRSVAKLQQRVETNREYVVRSGKEFPYEFPTLEEVIAQAMPAQPAPGDRLQKKLLDARLSEQQVLVIATPADSQVCRLLMTLLYLSPDGIRKLNPAEDLLTDMQEGSSDYTRLAIDTSSGQPLKTARPFLEKLMLPIPGPEGATFAILDAEGRVIVSTTAAELADGNNFDGFKFARFLKQHTHRFPDAEQMLSRAFADAKRTGKRVWFQEGGPQCAPCLKLSRYLLEQRELLAADYVLVKIDSRFLNGPAVIRRVRGHSGGIPWMAVLDSDGKSLVTSDGPAGNIGFPSSEAEIAHFETMLRTTARTLTEANIGTLVGALSDRTP